MTYCNISPKEAYQKVQDGYTYLDVRTVDEFKNGHPKGAVNIPIFVHSPQGRQPNPDFLSQVQEKFPKGTKLVIGCHAGGRSAKACQMLSPLGYQDIFNVDGGFGGRIDPETGEPVKGWRDENLPCG